MHESVYEDMHAHKHVALAHEHAYSPPSMLWSYTLSP